MKKRDMALLILSLALAVFSAVQLIGRISSTEAGKQADRKMREIYHAEERQGETFPTLTPRPPEAEIPERTAAATAASEETPDKSETPTETDPPETIRSTRLKRSMYPDNPGLRISERFRELRKENGDIVGWLTIGQMQDEAVTQRNNEFYMDHDVSGRENVSGAIFLDELITLQSRPYTLILYGHNMRDESRFGWLRKYDDQAFYRKNMYIDFNTIYEDGRYVIFSEGIISTEKGEANYLDFFDLDSLRPEERERAIRVLRDVSVPDSAVDVKTDDQILLLVTCVDRDTDRRIVAARRIREGEDAKASAYTAAGNQTAETDSEGT